MKLDIPRAPVQGVCDTCQVLLDVRVHCATPDEARDLAERLRGIDARAVLALLEGATREAQP